MLFIPQSSSQVIRCAELKTPTTNSDTNNGDLIQVLPVNNSETEIGETAEPDGSSATIANTPSEYSIEADVSLNGTGSGYHAKLVACTAESAVSFGIQYDAHAPDPFTGKAAFIIENVASNDPGQQSYTRTGFAELNKTFKLLLTIQSDGTSSVYVNGIKVGEVKNDNLTGKKVYLRVEGSGRRNGDSVDAVFSNIKLKGHNEYVEDLVWKTQPFLTNDGVLAEDNYQSERTVHINGTISGLSSEGEWDSEYESVSGIIQFGEPSINHLALAVKAWWKSFLASDFVKDLQDKIKLPDMDSIISSLKMKVSNNILTGSE